MDVSYTVPKPKDPAPEPLRNTSTSPSVPRSNPGPAPQETLCLGAWERGRSPKGTGHTGKGLEGALGQRSQENSECGWVGGGAPRSCPVPSPCVSPRDPQGDSRPGPAFTEGERVKEGKRKASRPAQAGASLLPRHTFPFGACAGCTSRIKLRPCPGGSGLL